MEESILCIILFWNCPTYEHSFIHSFIHCFLSIYDEPDIFISATHSRKKVNKQKSHILRYGVICKNVTNY